MATVVLAGALDTKGGEYIFARDKIRSLGSVATVLLIDVGIRSTSNTLPRADIDSAEVIAAAGGKYEDLKNLHRAEAFVLMTRGLTHILLNLYKKGGLHGIIGMGGGCSTSMLAPAFQQLPLGLPKLIVSSVIAYNSVRPFIGATDIILMYSVTDFSGHINRVNKQLVSNAAVAIASMAADYAANGMQHSSPGNLAMTTMHTKPLIAASMIGSTQACVLAAEAQLNKFGYEVVTFHCVGAGGEAMENLIASGAVDGVLDITLMEVLHSIIPGSLLDSGPNRLETAGRLGIPQVVSLGALDIVTFGPWSKFPVEYHTRAAEKHNAFVAAVRSSHEECTRVGAIIATKLNRARGPVTLFMPHGGFSSMSYGGGALADAAADNCLFESLRAHIDPQVVQLVDREEYINDPKFGQALGDALHEQLKHKLPKSNNNN